MRVSRGCRSKFGSQLRELAVVVGSQLCELLFVAIAPLLQLRYLALERGDRRSTVSANASVSKSYLADYVYHQIDLGVTLPSEESGCFDEVVRARSLDLCGER
jgi:hypothetical protein